MRTIQHCLLALALVGTPVLASEAPLLLSLHGSNTLGQRLVPALARSWAVAEGWQEISVSEPAFDELELHLTKGGQSARIFIAAHGTGTGLAALKDGRADLWMASRSATPDEVKTSTPLIGRLDSPNQEHVIALDGLSVIVAPGRAVSEISLDAVQAIFVGKIRDWSGLGSRLDSVQASPIRVFARDDRSGTYDTFKQLVLQGSPLVSRAVRFESTDALANAVADDDSAIGFVGMGGVGKARALALAYPGMAPMAADAQSVATEDYPLARRLFLYSAAESRPEARAFVEFVQSDAGQNIVAATGFVAQTIRLSSTPPRADWPAQYRELVAGASRLPVNLRFGNGVSYLDSKAMRDLARIADFFRDQPRSSYQISLIGFSDRNEGNPIQAVYTAEDRADYVASALAKHGISVYRVRGLGQQLAVAPNDSEIQRAKNRRVEVWVRQTR